VLSEHEGSEEERAWSPSTPSRVTEKEPEMKARMWRLAITFAAIAATALAGGATLKGY
jgi:hypothetical protein